MYLKIVRCLTATSTRKTLDDVKQSESYIFKCSNGLQVQRFIFDNEDQYKEFSRIYLDSGGHSVLYFGMQPADMDVDLKSNGTIMNCTPYKQSYMEIIHIIDVDQKTGLVVHYVCSNHFVYVLNNDGRTIDSYQ